MTRLLRRDDIFYPLLLLLVPSMIMLAGLNFG